MASKRHKATSLLEPLRQTPGCPAAPRALSEQHVVHGLGSVPHLCSPCIACWTRCLAKPGSNSIQLYPVQPLPWALLLGNEHTGPQKEAGGHSWPNVTARVFTPLVSTDYQQVPGLMFPFLSNSLGITIVFLSKSSMVNPGCKRLSRQPGNTMMLVKCAQLSCRLPSSPISLLQGLARSVMGYAASPPKLLFSIQLRLVMNGSDRLMASQILWRIATATAFSLTGANQSRNSPQPSP